MRYTPSVDEGERAYIDGLLGTSRTRAESAAEYRRMIAEVERAAAARAFAQGVEAALDTTGQHGLGLLTLIGNPYAAALGLTAEQEGETE